MTIKNYLPAGENISTDNCNGPIAARFLTVTHSTQGISVSLTAYSAFKNYNYTNFSLGYGRENSERQEVKDYFVSDRELYVRITNKRSNGTTRVESDNYVLRVKVLDSITRSVRIENYNNIFFKNVMECTVRY